MNPETEAKVREAFDLLGVTNFLDLSNAYSREDQELMKARTWDDQNPDLITNRIKSILEQINPVQLSDYDRVWWREILWFWHHHAISFAVWGRKDKILAQAYAGKALDFQADDHPNRITMLL